MLSLFPRVHKLIYAELTEVEVSELEEVDIGLKMELHYPRNSVAFGLLIFNIFFISGAGCVITRIIVHTYVSTQHKSF